MESGSRWSGSRPPRRLRAGPRPPQTSAAAEFYAHQEGIVNVYSDETPGREFVDQARASLSADVMASATDVGSTLTIGEAPDLAKLPQTTTT